MVNVPSGFNNLKTKVDDLDVSKLKTVPVDLNKLNVVVSKEEVKNTKFSEANKIRIKYKNKIPVATTLITMNQYNTDKQNLKKKIGVV